MPRRGGTGSWWSPHLATCAALLVHGCMSAPGIFPDSPNLRPDLADGSSYRPKATIQKLIDHVRCELVEAYGDHLGDRKWERLRSNHFQAAIDLNLQLTRNEGANVTASWLHPLDYKGGGLAVVPPVQPAPTAANPNPALVNLQQPTAPYNAALAITGQLSGSQDSQYDQQYQIDLAELFRNETEQLYLCRNQDKRDRPAGGLGGSLLLEHWIQEGLDGLDEATRIISPPAFRPPYPDETYYAGGNPVPASAGELVDVQPLLITGAQVSIAAGAVGGDALSAQPSHGLSAFYDAGTHTLYLKGEGSVEQYRDALSSVRFSSAAADPTDGGRSTSRSLAVVVSYGAEETRPVHVTLPVSASPPPTSVESRPVEVLATGARIASPGSTGGTGQTQFSSKIDFTLVMGASGGPSLTTEVFKVGAGTTGGAGPLSYSQTKVDTLVAVFAATCREPQPGAETGYDLDPEATTVEVEYGGYQIGPLTIETKLQPVAGHTAGVDALATLVINAIGREAPIASRPVDAVLTSGGRIYPAKLSAYFDKAALYLTGSVTDPGKQEPVGALNLTLAIPADGAVGPIKLTSGALKPLAGSTLFATASQAQTAKTYWDALPACTGGSSQTDAFTQSVVQQMRSQISFIKLQSVLTPTH